MKTFTRLFSMAALAVLSSTAFGQFDLAVTAMSLSSTGAPNYQVPPGHNATISYTIKNVGTNVIATGQSFERAAVRNGTTILVGPNTVTLAADLAPGDSITYFTSAPYVFDASITIQNVCMVVSLDSTETDTLNNAFCRSYTVSTTANPDVAATALVINVPNNLDGFDIDNGNNTPPPIEDMTLTIENVGNMQYTLGSAFSFEISLDGEVLNATASMSSTWAPGASLNLDITNTAVIPSVPQDSGTYNVCVSFVDADDNPANDEACATFTLVDEFDVNNPDNWPLGVGEENIVESTKIYTSEQFLVIENVTSAAQVRVTDMQGKIVLNEKILENSRMNLNTASGVYLVTTRTSENIVNSVKITL